MKRFFLVTTTLLLGAWLAGASEAQNRKAAPDFTAKDLDGKEYKLSDLKGKIVVLEAYNLDCPFCANHFKSGAMQELQADLTSKGAVWLLVNSTHPRSPSYRSTEAAKQEIDKHGIKATAWINDSTGKLGKLYELKTTPHMVVIDKQGRIAYEGAIDDRAEASGDPRQARNYVGEAVTALLAGKEVAVAKTKPYGCGIKYAN